MAPVCEALAVLKPKQLIFFRYYFGATTATAPNFVDPQVFNLLQDQISTVKDIVASMGLNSKPIWLGNYLQHPKNLILIISVIGETSSAYGGGAPDYSNKFISTFIWLDKLGLAAQNGLEVVIRQSFYNGYYALLYKDYTPAPDYWISILHKMLVGPEVVGCFMKTSEEIRLYCQCAKDKASTVVVFGMNLKDSVGRVRLQGVNKNKKVYAYVVTTEYSLLST